VTSTKDIYVPAPLDPQRPDSLGRFGQFGGKYVPETLMPALAQLEAALSSTAAILASTKNLKAMRDYVGRQPYTSLSV